jgi:hypothetical protein
MSVQTHAQNLITLAQQADGLVDQFRQLVADMQAEEKALFLESVKTGPKVQDAVSGRRRLWAYALSRAAFPTGSTVPADKAKTVEQLSRNAWQHFADGGV